MKTFSIVVVLTLLFSLFVGCGNSDSDQDKFHYQTVTEVDTLHTKIVYQNDYATATRITLHTGEQVPVHAGGNRLLYSMSDYTIKLVEDDIETTKEWTKGDIHWHSDVHHSVENAGNTTATYLVIARNENPLPQFKIGDLDIDVSHTDSESSELILENAFVKVVRVALQPGETISSHGGINRIVLSQTSYALTFESEETGRVELTFDEDDMNWFLPGTHSLENTGSTPAQFLVISFKQ
jgi:quercetin dioxygenase-like cupin family protein